MSSGPDLEAVLDEQVGAEFDLKDVDATMRTMVEQPYVWQPALAGAAGGTPSGASTRPIDEFVLEFTRDREVPFMLPGVAPTRRRVRIPTVVVMGFMADKVAFEHISSDQASVLVQIGLLDPAGLRIAGFEQAERLLELALS